MKDTISLTSSYLGVPGWLGINLELRIMGSKEGEKGKKSERQIYSQRYPLSHQENGIYLL